MASSRANFKSSGSITPLDGTASLTVFEHPSILSTHFPVNHCWILAFMLDFLLWNYMHATMDHWRTLTVLYAILKEDRRMPDVVWESWPKMFRSAIISILRSCVGYLDGSWMKITCLWRFQMVECTRERFVSLSLCNFTFLLLTFVATGFRGDGKSE